MEAKQSDCRVLRKDGIPLITLMLRLPREAPPWLEGEAKEEYASLLRFAEQTLMPSLSARFDTEPSARRRFRVRPMTLSLDIRLAPADGGLALKLTHTLHMKGQLLCRRVSESLREPESGALLPPKKPKPPSPPASAPPPASTK